MGVVLIRFVRSDNSIIDLNINSTYLVVRYYLLKGLLNVLKKLALNLKSDFIFSSIGLYLKFLILLF